MLTGHPSLSQKPPNSNLPLNALGSHGPLLPCGPPAQPTLRATPPPNASASLLQQHHASAQAQVPPQPTTPVSTGGPSSTPTHMPSSHPGPPSAMGTPDPSQPITPLQPQTEPPSQMQQPTSEKAQHPSTPVRYWLSSNTNDRKLTRGDHWQSILTVLVQQYDLI